MYTEANLACLVICRAVNLSIERGNSDGSTFAYVMLGALAGARFGDYTAGLRFGQLGYELVERRRLKGFQARVYNQFGTHVLPWTKPIRTCRDLLRRAFEVANRNGDLTFSAYSCHALTTNLLAAGDPLPEVQPEAEHGLSLAEKTRFRVAIDLITIQLGLIRTLRGLTLKFGSFNDEQFDEVRIERRLSANPGLARAEFSYWTRKLQLRFLAGDYASAVNAAARGRPLARILGFAVEAAEYHFYAALSHAACCGSVSSDRRASHLEVLTIHHKQLEIWAANCLENFESRVTLVGAEIARVEGRELDAERLYEEAIRSAQANGFIHHEALANELAARFYAARGFEKIARLYLQDSRHGYLRWGADGKVRQIDEIYPHLREAEPAPASASTIAAPVEHLDLATVITVSQAVAGEIVLEKLIDTLMRTAIEQAGAERGLLLLPRGAESRIEAEATTDGDAVVVQLRTQPVTAAVLPESVLHYVLRTQESVILDDAATQPPFAADPYIHGRQARSILCLPLLTQAKLIGLLYLENTLASGVFAPGRIAVLKLLASQAAIALENARLYGELAEREAKISYLVDANIIGIFLWGSKGQILEANDAFLRIVGYDREDLAAGRLSWTDLTPPEWLDREATLIQEREMTGRLQPFEKEYFRKDGSRVPVLIGVAGFEESMNQGVAFVVDLTERKRAEYLTRQVFESSPDRVCIVGRDYRYQQVNPAFARRWGLPAAAIVGMHIADFMGMENFEQTLKGYLDQCFAGEEVSYEAWFTLSHGRRYLTITNSPLRPDSERVESALVIIRDLTEHMLASEALREAQRQLAHANRVTTMGQLTASIAHEINQPIAATVTNAQAALRWLDAQPPNLEETRQTVARIVTNGIRAGDVIGRIRALIIDKVATRTDRLDINDTITEVVALVRSELSSSGVALQTQFEQGLPLMQGDRVQLQQVILNLIVNAIEAMSSMSEGVRELWISTEVQASDGALVAVRDSGPGLDPASLERLFDAFYTTKYSGMGMGLSICRSIIEAHGGRLWAEPNEPRGAIFRFTLPARL